MIYDAIVLGAGPAGATAAHLLARAGWAVAVVEKRTFPRRKVCGEFVSATNQPLLQRLGVADAFLSLAGPAVQRVGLIAGKRTVTAAMPEAAISSGGWGRALARECLDGLLLDAAAGAGARIWQPWTAVRLERNGYGHACTIATGDSIRQLRARVVIAACGSWERGPHPIPFDRTHRSSDLLGFKAHFENCSLPPDLMPLLVFPGGYGGMVRCDSGLVSFSCCIRRDALAQIRQPDRQPAGAAVFEHIRANCAGVEQYLNRVRVHRTWLSAGPIRPGIRCQSVNDVYAIGNLAGEAHPLIAEGISMAMQSAWLLCQSLVARGDIAKDHALDQTAADYRAAWRASFVSRIRAAAAFAKLTQQPRLVAGTLLALQRVPDLLTYGALLSGKVRQVVPRAGSRKAECSGQIRPQDNTGKPGQFGA